VVLASPGTWFVQSLLRIFASTVAGTVGLALLAVLLLPTARAVASCRPPGDEKLLAANTPADVAVARARGGAGPVVERTEYYLGGQYWVTHCDPSTGRVLRSAIVGPLETPDGRVVRAVSTTIEPLVGDGFVYTTSEYPRPTDPVWLRQWSRNGRRALVARVPAPTDEGTYRALLAKPRAARARVARLARRKAVTSRKRGISTGRGLRARAAGYYYKCQSSQYVLFGFRWPWIPEWGKAGYSFYKNPQGFPNWDTAFQRVDNGHATWSLVSPNYCGLTQITNYGDNGAGISWDHWAPNLSDGWNVTDFGDLTAMGCNASALACAATVTDGQGNARDTGNRFNPSYWWWTEAGSPPGGAYDLWSVTAHEAGHSLGLAHSNELPNFDNGQIMNSWIAAGDDAGRHQGVGDWEGSHRLYGPCGHC
jgi:Matrixin